MLCSRRDFLCFGGSVTATASALWSMTVVSKASTFTPSRFEQDEDVILLNSNENAYGPSRRVREAISAAVAGANRYPRMKYGALVERIAGHHGVNSEQVLLGCGSTEIIRMAALAFLGGSRRLIQASPTFEAIERYARTTGSEVISVPLTSAFAHDLEGMLGHAGTSTGLVYICNPNNPTASLTPRKDLENFIKQLPASSFVLIDEAYHQYAGTSGMYSSFIDHPLDDERLIVVRTFSKVYGLAGLRLGYAIGRPGTIQRMKAFATEDDVNAIVAQVASDALEDVDAINDFVNRNANDRQEFFNQAMARMLKPIDSHANFVMMNTLHPAEEVIQHFRKNHILVGHRCRPMDTYIRVSLGRPEEMRAFWHAWDLLPYARNVMHH